MAATQLLELRQLESVIKVVVVEYQQVDIRDVRSKLSESRARQANDVTDPPICRELCV
jgi:hypothetical protein